VKLLADQQIALAAHEDEAVAELLVLDQRVMTGAARHARTARRVRALALSVETGEQITLLELTTVELDAGHEHPYSVRPAPAPGTTVPCVGPASGLQRAMTKPKPKSKPKIVVIGGRIIIVT
jgi:hypothetical protein